MAVQLQPVRRLTAAATLLALALAGCSAMDEGTRYLSESTFRRDALVASLEATTNRYAALRLERYERAWSELPEWNPLTETLDATFARRGDERVLALDDPNLGREAFFRYPVQPVSRLDAWMGTPEAWDALGLATTDGFGGGVVLERVANGSQRAALSCASCHARVVDGELVSGLANQALALGAMFDAPWPRGQLDVSLGTDEAPIAIPDLRVASLQRYLHASGEVRNSRVALAIRIETLIITSHGGAVRPPREIALALADYLSSLVPPALPTQPSAGARHFEQACARCHEGEQRAGGLVSPDVVGTDPQAARSADRGTGEYRVPSLRGVGARGALLHDASVSDLSRLLDPGRSGGHRFGQDLDTTARAQLEAFVRGL